METANRDINDARSVRPADGIASPVRRIGLLCGTGPGTSGRDLAFANELGRELGQAGLEIVFGEPPDGQLGAAIRAARAAGSPITGVLPYPMMRAGTFPMTGGVLQVVRTVAQRRQVVYQLVDGFVVLPGGSEILNEIGELLASRKVATVVKPIVLANQDGYFDHLLALLEHAREKAFMTAAELRVIDVARSPDEVLRGLGRSYSAANR